MPHLRYGVAPGVQSMASLAQLLWCLSYPDQALQRSREAVGSARELSHLHSLACSSCLSCHAAARVPRSSKGLLGFRFDMEDLSDSAAVREHVDIWFQNLESGALFDPGEPALAALDYSLQLDAATFRMCRACDSPFMRGATPRLCIDSGFFTLPTCRGSAITTVSADLPFRAESEAALPPPPRQ